MIVIDTSAITSVLYEEPAGPEIERKLLNSPGVMSAATRVELGIVVEAKSGPAGSQLLDELLSRTRIAVVPVDEDLASDALVAWRRWGKGRHPASLNFGDTFSYALARRLGAPLLFAGNDFSQTDVEVA